ncbi:MAG TPA: ABC transporter substrate-binding protein, partial [Methylomirabilota bacterium]|nr:ABC transporter substrate-binding protein [Methylomirabilota bacterium]
FLLGRAPMPGFRWSDLVGKTVIGFAEAPTPWQCMLTVLRRNGVDPAAVRIERERHVPEALAAFRDGHGDFLEQTQPIVEQMLASGEAHLVASMGEATGPVPFTSYMTTPDFLRREPDTVLRFTRALYRTQRWLAGHDAKAIAEVIAPDFPNIERVILERAVDRFSRQGTWARDPILRQPGFDYLQEILQTGGFIRKSHRYEDLVDTSIAERAVREMEVRP